VACLEIGSCKCIDILILKEVFQKVGYQIGVYDRLVVKQLSTVGNRF
jgi:hypothetical protein